MQSLTREQSQYMQRNEVIEKELAQYIPISDVAMIIADYAIGASPFMCNPIGKCDHCNAKHRRQVSNLCMGCKDLCFLCKRTTCSEKMFVCVSCIAQRKDYEIRSFLAMSGRKDQMYRELFNIRFPSEVHQRVVASMKIKDAARAEAKKLEDEFKAREAEKSMVDRYIECRAKLWKLQEIINDYKRTHHAPELPAQPVFPMY